MWGIILIALALFVVLALLYEFKQHPEKFKKIKISFKKKEKKVKPVKEVVDPNTMVDDSKLSYNELEYDYQEEQQENVVDRELDDLLEEKPKTINPSKNEKLEDLLENMLDEDDNYMDFDEMFDEEQSDLFEGVDAVDAVEADSLDGNTNKYADISKTIRQLPAPIKVLMLSNVLDKKKL